MSEPTSKTKAPNLRRAPRTLRCSRRVEDWSVDLDDDDLDYEHPDDYSKQGPTNRPTIARDCHRVVGLAVLAGAVIFGRSSSPALRRFEPDVRELRQVHAASVKITQIQAKEPTSGPTAAQAKSITAIFNTEPPTCRVPRPTPPHQLQEVRRVDPQPASIVRAHPRRQRHGGPRWTPMSKLLCRRSSRPPTRSATGPKCTRQQSTRSGAVPALRRSRACLARSCVLSRARPGASQYQWPIAVHLCRQLKAYENIPIVSWCLLRGTSSCCKSLSRSTTCSPKHSTRSPSRWLSWCLRVQRQ